MSEPAIPSPLVSVVIPTFNYAHYLPAAVQSVLAQTVQDLELVIVDDGSTDGTREVASRFLDHRVRYLYQKNAGLAAARNTGIRESRGAFLGFLDADDLWCPNFLEVVLATFRALPEGFAAVATSSQRIDPAGLPFPYTSTAMAEEREMSARDFIFRNRPLSSSILIKREAFFRCGLFDETLAASEDRDMWIRIAAQFRFYYLKQELAQLRRHPRNMSREPQRMSRSMATVIRNAFRRGDAPRYDVFFWLRVLSNYLVQTSWLYHDAGRHGQALARIVPALLIWPLPLPHRTMGEPRFFRIRALLRFLFHASSGTTRTCPQPA